MVTDFNSERRFLYGVDWKRRRKSIQNESLKTLNCELMRLYILKAKCWKFKVVHVSTCSNLASLDPVG